MPQDPVLLNRTVRFSVNDDASPIPIVGLNGYAGVPTMSGLGRYYELDVTCRGVIDPLTGYFVNIKEIDAAARRAALPVIADACRTRPRTPAWRLMPEVFAALGRALDGRLARLRWRLTPTYSVEMTTSPGQPGPRGSSAEMAATQPDAGEVLVRQRFEFAASHRLHTAALSDSDNQRCFGKCNHPSGHGHNYVVEPAIAISPASTMALADIERLVGEVVIDRFDHKHLNLDTREFASDGGLNPSVENIAKVCYRLLKEPVAARGGRLHAVTVWETEKTSCTFPA